LLKRTSTRDVRVRPVLLFPAWWINQLARDCRTWVLNPKQLRAFLGKGTRSVDEADLADALVRRIG